MSKLLTPLPFRLEFTDHFFRPKTYQLAPHLCSAATPSTKSPLTHFSLSLAREESQLINLGWRKWTDEKGKSHDSPFSSSLIAPPIGCHVSPDQETGSYKSTSSSPLQWFRNSQAAGEACQRTVPFPPLCAPCAASLGDNTSTRFPQS